MDKTTVEQVFYYMLEDVKENYREKTRFFHNLEHLYLGYEEIDSYVDWYVENISKDKNDTSIKMEQIAAWMYHDIVYDVKNAHDNEKLSAIVAMEKLKETSLDLSIVENIILDTKAHKATIPESKLILDIDMASLGYEYDKFLHYRKLALKEYSLIYNENQLFEGVLSFINATIKNKEIYHLDYFKEKYQSNAENNLIRYKEDLLKTKRIILDI